MGGDGNVQAEMADCENEMDIVRGRHPHTPADRSKAAPGVRKTERGLESLQRGNVPKRILFYSTFKTMHHLLHTAVEFNPSGYPRFLPPAYLNPGICGPNLAGPALFRRGGKQKK